MTFRHCLRLATYDVLRVLAPVLLVLSPLLLLLPADSRSALFLFASIILTWNFSLTGKVRPLT